MEEWQAKLARPIPAEEVLAGKLQNPEFASAFEALDGAYELARAMISGRDAGGMSCEDLAHATGIPTNTIVRIESMDYTPTLLMVQGICDALDLQIRFVPREEE